MSTGAEDAEFVQVEPPVLVQTYRCRLRGSVSCTIRTLHVASMKAFEAGRSSWLQWLHPSLEDEALKASPDARTTWVLRFWLTPIPSAPFEAICVGWAEPYPPASGGYDSLFEQSLECAP